MFGLYIWESVMLIRFGAVFFLMLFLLPYGGLAAGLVYVNPVQAPVLPQDIDTVYFAEHSAELSVATRDVLDRQVTVLLRYSGAISDVYGHCAAAEEADQEGIDRLALARARSVKDYLVAHGIEPQRLRVRSWGAGGVGLSNETPDAIAKLRFVQVTPHIPQ